jgi:hypothetical protein
MPKKLQGMIADPSTPPSSPSEASIPDPSMMGGEAQVDPENEAGMRADLERMLGKAEDKNAAFEEKQALSTEKLEGLKTKVVKEIFELMKDLGVDPSDLKSINEFLQKLQQQDPDLYIMFESAISSLSPEGAIPGIAPGMEAAPVPEIAGMEAAPGILGAEAKPAIPGMEVAPGPGPGPGPIEEGGGSLMENNTKNLQENILRR